MLWSECERNGADTIQFVIFAGCAHWISGIRAPRNRVSALRQQTGEKVKSPITTESLGFGAFAGDPMEWSTLLNYRTLSRTIGRLLELADFVPGREMR